MCFSAGASFTGAAIISATGVATLNKVKDPSEKAFAAVPLVFGIQQFAEGIVWTTLKPGGNESLQDPATIIFLIAALLVWPVLMPLSLWMMERDNRRKKFISLFLATGIIVAVYYAICMINIKSYPVVESHHIRYAGEFPRQFVIPVFILYLLATITPLFISSVKRTNIMGILIFLSVAVSGFFYREYLTSVWCFFAALISVVIYWILCTDRQQEDVRTVPLAAA